jgi:hypothetical protein
VGTHDVYTHVRSVVTSLQYFDQIYEHVAKIVQENGSLRDHSIHLYKKNEPRNQLLYLHRRNKKATPFWWL